MLLTVIHRIGEPAVQYHSVRIPINNSDKINYLGNDVRKKIREKEDKEKETVLLDYPVVYVHTWKKGEVRNFYVGETIDLVRRTDEHEKCGQDDKTWQEDWLQGDDRLSYYFGSRQMNKSLCMDLEDTLIECLTLVCKKETKFKIRNKRKNEQGAYNNSCCKGELLREIWKDLSMDFPLGELNYEENSIEIPACEDKLIPFCIKVNPDTTMEKIKEKIKKEHPNDWQYLIEYPVVYMHCWIGTDNEFCVYTGEANNLLSRTDQHQNIEKNDIFYIDGTIDEREDWHNSWKESSERYMFVFGHPQFNKSMTLDIENRLIQYNIFHKYAKNGRTNKQREYNNSEKMHAVFCEIVDYLNKIPGKKFMTLAAIKDKSAFMASALMELTQEQKETCSDIENLICQAMMDCSKKRKLIVVYGSAGTGKTVLASRLFFNLLETDYEDKKINSYILVNHKELFNMYTTQANAWNITRNNEKKNSKLIYLPSEFLTKCKKGEIEKPDVLLIDEAHLLKENGQGGSYMENTQLTELVRNSKVTVLMFDPRQFMEKNKFWGEQWNNKKTVKDIKDAFEEYVERNKIADVDVSCYRLQDQMRMQNCDKETMQWIRNLACEGCKIDKFPGGSEYKIDNKKQAVFCKDKTGYEIGIFMTLKGLKEAISEKKANNENPSSLLATYEKEWKYQEGAYISRELCLKWHTTGKKEAIKDNIWTLSANIDVGAFHDIQGFDLKYAAVIIGETYKYKEKDGIIFDRKRHQKVPKDQCNEKLANELISNELNVLLTRGAKGLYIYACDLKLREALLNAMKE